MGVGFPESLAHATTLNEAEWAASMVPVGPPTNIADSYHGHTSPVALAAGSAQPVMMPTAVLAPPVLAPPVLAPPVLAPPVLAPTVMPPSSLALAEESLEIDVEGPSSSSPDEPGQQTPQVYEKPPYSYAQMVTQAIMESPNLQCTLKEIYKFITDSYHYFRYVDKGWQV